MDFLPNCQLRSAVAFRFYFCIVRIFFSLSIFSSSLGSFCAQVSQVAIGRPPPLVAAGVDEVVLGRKLVGLAGASGPVDVRDGRRPVLLDVVQERGEDPPGLRQLVGPDEVHLGADEHVEDEPLVGVGHPRVLVPGVVGEVEFGLLDVEAHAGRLGHHLAVDGLAGLDADHQLVADGVAAEDVAGDVAELHPDLGLALVEGLAGPQDEGDPLPALVVQAEDGAGVRGGDGALGHGRVVQVAELAVVVRPVGVADILAEDDVVHEDRRDALEHLHLLVADVVGVRRGRLLHGG